MLAQSGSGTLAGSVHDQAFRQIARGVSRRIAQAFQQQIDKRRAAAKFPGRPMLAYFELTAPEYRDINQAVTNVVALAGAGYALEAQTVAELTGLNIPEKSNDSAQQLLKNLYPLIAAGYRPPETVLEKLLGIKLELVPTVVPAAPVATVRARAQTALASEGESAPVLSTLQQIFASLEALAADPATTDAQLSAAVAKAAEQFPELLPDLTAAIARPLAIDMAQAAVEGAVEGAQEGTAT
jgi:hypothetical protein